MGSEHQINGVRYPIEAHLLFYHESQKSMDDAMRRDEKGLKSVMAVFGEVSAIISLVSKYHSKLINNIQCLLYLKITDDKNKYVLPYARALKYVIRAHTDYMMPKKDLFPLGAMLPANVTMSGYYHYDGSLTTPPCTEGIGWLVLTKPFRLSSCDVKPLYLIKQNHSLTLWRYSQMRAFRRLEDDDGNLISGNFRTVQPLVERVIYKVAT